MAKKWTKREKQYVRDHWEEMTDAEMAGALPDRSEGAVRHYRQRRGLVAQSHGRHNLWTEEEEQYLQDHWRDMMDAEIAKALGRTKYAVQIHRYRLGLKKGVGNPTHTDPPGEAMKRSLYVNYKYNAERRGYEWGLTLEQFTRLTKMPCHYCGIEPSQVADGEVSGNGCKGCYVYNGIDRVDNDHGYVLGNVVPCCGDCNLAKKDRSVAEFKEWLIRAYEHLIGSP